MTSQPNEATDAAGQVPEAEPGRPHLESLPVIEPFGFEEPEQPALPQFLDWGEDVPPEAPAARPEGAPSLAAMAAVEEQLRQDAGGRKPHRRSGAGAEPAAVPSGEGAQDSLGESQAGAGDAAPARQAGSRTASARRASGTPVKRRKRIHPVVWAFLALLAAVVVALGLFSVLRWLVPNDAADIQGKWKAEGAENSIVIDESTIDLAGEATYSYTLDTQAKTVHVTFGDYEGLSHYRFSFDRSSVAIMDTTDASWVTTFGQDLLWSLKSLVAAVQGETLSPLEGDGIELFSKEALKAAKEAKKKEEESSKKDSDSSDDSDSKKDSSSKDDDSDSKKDDSDSSSSEKSSSDDSKDAEKDSGVMDVSDILLDSADD